MQKFNFSYDKENDDLFIYSSKSKSKGCVELGNLVFDYDSKGELVGLQIMKASASLEDMSGQKISIVSEILKNLKECKVETKLKNNLLTIKVYLFSDAKEIASVISVPSIIESSPSLAYA